ncbi:MAG: hypothetical protein RIF39_16015 [Cyclobacteriaceae bacterium]
MNTKYLLFLICLWLAQPAHCQLIDTDYFPEFEENVSLSEYNHGREILRNAYRQIKEDGGNVNYADYWNVAVAYANMGVDKGIVFPYLIRSKNIAQEKFCMIANYQISLNGDIEEAIFYKMFDQAYVILLQGCEGMESKPLTIEKLKAEKEKMSLTGLSESLIDRLIVCMEKDQRFRYSPTVYTENWEKQNALDDEVQEEMISILEEFDYPGRDLVGDRFMNFACLFIEHGGDLDYQDKYLPVVVDAFHNGQMSKSYLTMLIDRIHWKHTGKQLFGSHAAIPFDEPEIISQVIELYNLN